ncbi:hypothetical protein L484_013691 [Morus notabilis]|uniref:Uncharacterized protein n=1 Tax=Morus notabilis TaxID=981085 RepID=W9QFW5_9ROSA|nr:hypothetical protein L484_013691 [Morus notabilis]
MVPQNPFNYLKRQKGRSIAMDEPSNRSAPLSPTVIISISAAPLSPLFDENVAVAVSISLTREISPNLISLTTASSPNHPLQLNHTGDATKTTGVSSI